MSKFVWIPFKTANHIVATRETFLRQRARSAIERTPERHSVNIAGVVSAISCAIFFTKSGFTAMSGKRCHSIQTSRAAAVCQIRQANKTHSACVRTSTRTTSAFSAKQPHAVAGDTCPANPSCSSSRRFNPSTCALQNRTAATRLFGSLFQTVPRRKSCLISER